MTMVYIDKKQVQKLIQQESTKAFNAGYHLGLTKNSQILVKVTDKLKIFDQQNKKTSRTIRRYRKRFGRL